MILNARIAATEFEPSESIREEVQKKLRNKNDGVANNSSRNLKHNCWKRKKRPARKQRKRSVKPSMLILKTNLLLEQNNKEKWKLKQARQQQLDFLKKEQELKTKEAELELRSEKTTGGTGKLWWNPQTGKNSVLPPGNRISKTSKLKEMEEKLEAQQTGGGNETQSRNRAVCKRRVGAGTVTGRNAAALSFDMVQEGERVRSRLHPNST